MSVKLRIELEKKIAGAALRALLGGGFVFNVVCDGEMDVVHSRSAKEVMNAMFNLDECTVEVVNDKTGHTKGWVKFVFGNDGHDCINDYTTNLEGFLKKANRIADKYAA